MSEETVKSVLFCSTRVAWTPRADSELPVSTYAGKSAFFGLFAPAADQGQLLTLKSHPLGGFSRWGVSSTDIRPRHSVAGSLPSTGRVQSKRVSRVGMKVAWKQAMT